jgi:hypothetical protein
MQIRVVQAAKQEPVFSVKLPKAAILATKRHARDTGQTIRSVVLTALQQAGIRVSR